MEIIDAQIDWREDVGNDPRLEVLVNETPDRTDLRFEHEDGLWVAIDNSYVEYFAWSGEGNDSGYSGRSFEITTVDGDEVTLEGPWSSRAGCVNKRRFGPVVDVQAIDLVNEDAHLERIIKFDSDEPYWIPVREKGGDA